MPFQNISSFLQCNIGCWSRVSDMYNFGGIRAILQIKRKSEGKFPQKKFMHEMTIVSHSSNEHWNRKR